MGLSSEYHKYADGAWQLWVLQEKWSTELWQNILALISEQSPSRHPQTVELHWPRDQLFAALYLKIFHSDFGWRALKDVFRQSKAVRFMHQTTALKRCNFNVPLVLAAGEKREHRVLRKAFVLTVGVNGQSLPVLLKQHWAAHSTATLLEKRRGLRHLAREIRRLHELGFVHGDLLPTNILVSGEGKERRFFFIDNDRTRRYPRWMTHFLRRRNLLQLNRLPLPGITLQDRVRFLSHYLELKQWGKDERRLLTWLEHKTRKRRRECDAVDTSGSFRQLMRWDGSLT